MRCKGLLFRAGAPLLLVVLLSFFGLQLHAQVTTSSINGKITDSKGEELPGATVYATHEPSGTRYGTASTETGNYVFPNVRVGGPYKITVSYIGFAEFTQTGIIAELGTPTAVNIVLRDDNTALQEVLVSAAASGFAGERTGAATAINATTLRNMPTVSRSITDFTRLTPQSNGNSFGGRDGRYNNFQVDGANFNNGFGLNDDPLPGGGGLSIDAIEEIQVNIAPFDVRQSGFSGAAINAVTRSGTNTFHGSVYGFLRNQDLQGVRARDFKAARPDAAAKTIGFRLGGPLIKNKLFFFVNAEQIVNTGASAGAVNLWRANEGSGEADADNFITRVRRSDMEAVGEHLRNTWNYDPGAYEGYANKAENKTLSFLARIDWNINDRNRLALRYNQTESNSPSLVNPTSGPNPRAAGAYARVSQNSMAFENTMYFTKNLVRSVTAELNSEITPKLSNQFLATYSYIFAGRSTNSSIFPMIDIGDGQGTNTVYQNYITAGYELFSRNNGVINDNVVVTNNLTLALGKHTLTGGVSFEYQKFGNSYQRMGTSYYRYASVADFLKTGTSEEVAPIQFGLTYPYAGEDPYAPAKYGLPAIYIQDKMEVSDRLTVTAGLRAEIPMFLNTLTPNNEVNQLDLLDVNGNVRRYDSGAWPDTRVMLSPRIGFRYDVNGDRSTILRGGTGIFAGRVPFVWLTNQPSLSGVIQNTIEPGGYSESAPWIGDIRFNPDPLYWLNNTPASAQNVFLKSPTGGVPSTVALVDKEFKMPQVWRTSIGIDHKIKNTPLTITADVLYTKDIQAVYQFGANRKPAVQRMNYAGDDREFYPNSDSYTYNDQIGGNSLSILTNTSSGYTVNASAGVTMRPVNGFSGSLFYSTTHGKAISDNPGSNAISAWGNSPTVNNPNDLLLHNATDVLPHRVVGSVSYTKDWARNFGTTVSIFYNGANRGRFSYTYNGDLNGDGIAADLLYVPEEASELNFTDIVTDGNVIFTAAEQLAAFEAYVSGVKVLNDARGGYVGRNAGLGPWLNRFDFRLLQDIFTNIGKNRHTLQLSVDVLNIGNLLNKNWGVQQTLIAGANNVLRRASVSGEGVPTFTMNTVSVDNKTVLPTTPFRYETSTAATWSMQVGVRYSF